MTQALGEHFPRHEQFDPAAPTWCVTPGEGRVIHRFFDTSPFGPSGRYLALTRLPAEDRMPEAGEAAQIVLVDLHAGTETTIARIRTVPDYEGPSHELRCDPHVAWDHTFRRVAFNACPDGTRRVFVADLLGLLC